MSQPSGTRKRKASGGAARARTARSRGVEGTASGRADPEASPPVTGERAREWIRELHATTTDFFLSSDPDGSLEEDIWVRSGGGGGVSRVLTEGSVFEKAGFNRAAVEGELEPDAAARLAGSSREEVGEEPVDFLATGVSVVAHPQSPLVPIVHMNVRYVEVQGPELGRQRWFGGGIDLTPTYPHPEDAAWFHRVLRTICERHHPGYYPRFKSQCDEYFVNTHRDDQMRGVGGIFFERLWTEPQGLEHPPDVFAFVRDVGESLEPAYGPIVQRRKDASFGDRERRLQMERRARYAEFNLIHDRGTRFGLESGARTESVLMSMPPRARWEYSRNHESGSFEARLEAMLEPRDWSLEPVDEEAYREVARSMTTSSASSGV